jgi:hypothetical protein
MLVRSLSVFAVWVAAGGIRGCLDKVSPYQRCLAKIQWQGDAQRAASKLDGCVRRLRV